MPTAPLLQCVVSGKKTENFVDFETNPCATSDNDESTSYSRDDKKILEIIGNDIHVNKDGFLETSLPFKPFETPLKNNRAEVLQRMTKSLSSLAKSSKKLDDSLKSMQKFLEKNHAEKVENLTGNESKTWYIPIFPVYHPKKGKARLVFDASACFQGQSLNKALLQGPDLNNKLYGALIRFRERRIAVMADIESMFHCFFVNESDRDFLRFFWWQDKDPSKAIVEYRMKVHIFGNTSSPSVAMYCLQYAAISSGNQVVIDFVTNNFYVDDGLACFDNVHEAVDAFKQTREVLFKYNIRLHKLISNDD